MITHGVTKRKLIFIWCATSARPAFTIKWQHMCWMDSSGLGVGRTWLGIIENYQ
jgi:hypothetical protein